MEVGCSFARQDLFEPFEVPYVVKNGKAVKLEKPLIIDHIEGEVLVITFVPSRPEFATHRRTEYPKNYEKNEFTRFVTVCVLIALEGRDNSVDQMDCSMLEDGHLVMKVKQEDDMAHLYQLVTRLPLQLIVGRRTNIHYIDEPLTQNDLDYEIKSHINSTKVSVDVIKNFQVVERNINENEVRMFKMWCFLFEREYE